MYVYMCYACIYTYICMCVYRHICVCVYIHIYRERERKREIYHEELFHLIVGDRQYNLKSV